MFRNKAKTCLCKIKWTSYVQFTLSASHLASRSWHSDILGCQKWSLDLAEHPQPPRRAWDVLKNRVSENGWAQLLRSARPEFEFKLREFEMEQFMPREFELEMWLRNRESLNQVGSNWVNSTQACSNNSISNRESQSETWPDDSETWFQLDMYGKHNQFRSHSTIQSCCCLI